MSDCDIRQITIRPMLRPPMASTGVRWPAASMVIRMKPLAVSSARRCFAAGVPLVRAGACQRTALDTLTASPRQRVRSISDESTRKKTALIGTFVLLNISLNGPAVNVTRIRS